MNASNRNLGWRRGGWSQTDLTVHDLQVVES